MIKTLQLNTWYKIEDYIEFKNLIYKYISKIHKVNNISGIIGDSKSYRCVEHICEEQRIEYIKILELHFDCIRYTTKIPDCETYIAITGSDCEEYTNPDCEEKENKTVEKKQGAFTLLENYYNEKLDKIDEELSTAQFEVLEHSDVYKQYKLFKEFIDKRAKELNILSTFSFDALVYLSIDDQLALKEIANYTQKQKDELRKECGTINALLEMTDDYDKQIDILTRYGVITLPKKRNIK